MSVSAVVVRTFAVVALAILLPVHAFADDTKMLNPSRASSKARQIIETGPIAKACGVRGKALGTAVEKGPGRWRLYDTAPGSIAQRAFYLTGFKDGCPRRLIGAVAMFGSVDLYELVHYSAVGIPPPRNGTDLAYARLRAQACGASRPCRSGGKRKLNRAVIFVNLYPEAVSPRRVEVLISGGKVAAISAK